MLSELLEQGISIFCIFDYFVFDNSFDFNNLARNPQVFGKAKPKPLGVSDEQEKFLYKLCYKNNFAFKKSDLMQQDWFDEIFLTTSDSKANNNQSTTDPQQIADLQAENARLQAENTDLLKRIAELESQTNITTLPNFDNSDFYTYPPELDMAIKIWYEIYQTDNLPKHFTNHSDKFTQACKNLGFKFDVKAMMERIKTVTTPQKAKEKTKNKNRQN